MCPDWLGQQPCEDRAACHDHGCQGPELGETAHQYVQGIVRLKFQIPARLRSLAYQVAPFELPHGTWLPCAAKDGELARGGYVMDGKRIPLCKAHRCLESLDAVLAQRQQAQGK